MDETTKSCMIEVINHGFCVVRGSCSLYRRQTGKYAVCLEEVVNEGTPDMDVKSIFKEFDSIWDAIDEFEVMSK